MRAELDFGFASGAGDGGPVGEAGLLAVARSAKAGVDEVVETATFCPLRMRTLHTWSVVHGGFIRV